MGKTWNTESKAKKVFIDGQLKANLFFILKPLSFVWFLLNLMKDE